MNDGERSRRAPAAVLWDMDGTLVDTEPYWIASEYELVAEHGGTWSEEHAHAIVGMDLRDAASYISEHGSVDMAIDDIVNRLLDDVTIRVRERVPWRPGARELLADLREHGVPTALVTMSWRRFADAVVEALPPDSFDVIVAGDEVANGKPHPEPYERAAELLGVATTECVAIEDSHTGMRSAVDAGCRVLVVPNVVPIEEDPSYTIVSSLTDVDAAALGVTAPEVTAEQPAVEPSAQDDSTPNHVRRRRLVAALIALAAIALAAVIVLATRDEEAAPPPPPDIPIDGWAPYWALDVADASVGEYGTWLREVSPFWFQATGATSIVEHDNVPVDAAAAFVQTARSKGAAIVPSITDGMASGQMAALLADPAQRSAHVAAIADFAAGGDYAGVDLDYESFAFKDARSTWATTRPNWVAFVQELAARLHADGRTLTVSVPPIRDAGDEHDRGYWVYDYAAMGEVVDHIRIMAYDYSTGGDPGPMAPLSYVREVIGAAKQAVDDDSKLVLGVPLGGYNWPTSTEGTCPTGTDTGVTSVNQSTIDDLLARRQATPVHDPTTGEASFTYTATFSDGTASCTQEREVHYVDAEGTAARVDLARTEHLGGAALWALGYDSPATWSAIGALARPDNGQGTAPSTAGSAALSG